MTTLRLYTAATTSGQKASILLEELKAAYGVEYEVYPVNLSKNEQKEPWFLEINPNGRIPTLVDDVRGGHKVFESGAILQYLAQYYDKDYKFSFDPASEHASDALQWNFFFNAGLGPMSGQLIHFKFASEQIPYAIERYEKEVRRLYSVIEARLQGRDYMAGPEEGQYSIADMSGFSWVNFHARLGIDDFGSAYPKTSAWLKKIQERPAVHEGLGVASRK